MYCGSFKAWSDITLRNLEQFSKLSQTSFSIAGNLLQTQIELAAALADITAYHAGNISQAKDAGEIASRQMGLAEEAGKVISETAHSTAEILSEAGKAYSKLFETSLASGAAFAANTGKASQKSAA